MPHSAEQQMFLCLKKYKQLLYLDKPELTKT